MSNVDIMRLKIKIKYIFDSYKRRDLIEEELEMLGFKLWGYLNDYYGRPNEDEQIWAYDVEVPNGQILILINWIEGFYWIYEKVSRGDMI